MCLPEKEMQSRVEKILSTNAKLPVQYLKMPGDASDRSYCRIQDAKKNNWILMFFEPDTRSLAEEKTPETNDFNELPFLNVRKLLQKRGLNVPNIIGHDEDFILLQDLGDEQLYTFVKEGPPKSDVLNYYKEALKQLSLLQVTKEEEGKQCVGFSRRFDADLYYWEFEHFLEYGVDWLLGTQHQHQSLRQYFKDLSEQLSTLPRCLSHRDYHSKNLLITTDKSLWVIDFQDAILAPCHYDVASLLYDSYIKLPDDVIEQLIEYYYGLMPTMLTSDSLNTFTKNLRIMALQRNLKAAGRFVYIYKKKGKATHIPYIAQTMDHVKSHLKYLGTYDDFSSDIPFSAIVEKAEFLLK